MKPGTKGHSHTLKKKAEKPAKKKVSKKKASNKKSG
jgi:hypothetical protein